VNELKNVNRMIKPLFTAALLGCGVAVGMDASLRRVFHVIWRCIVKN
jgi:hypothetical protein